MKKTLLLLLIASFSKLHAQECANPPSVNAGPDVTFCVNTSTVSLTGSVTGAGGATWSGGAGTFSNQNDLNTAYTPSFAEVTSGSVTLTLTSTGNGTCPASSDQVVINIAPAPVVSAGPDISLCEKSASAVLLGGMVSNATGGVWSTSGTGTFSPNASSLQPNYNFSAEDKNAGMLFFTLTSTGNGACAPVKDSLVLRFVSAPVLDAGPMNQSACGSEINLSVSVSYGSAIEWLGNGTFLPNKNAKEVTYRFTADEISQNRSIFFVKTVAGCYAFDSLSISIAPSPIVNAGSDITTNEYMANIKGSVMNATGGTWSTSGTGSFSPSASALETAYIISEADKTNGGVFLVLNSTGNGLCRSNSDTMRLEYKKTYLIKGWVRVGQDYMDHGRVNLYKLINGQYDLIETKVFKDRVDSSYYFNVPSPGAYIVFAALDTLSTQFKNFLPTYFGNTTEWNNASIIYVNEAYRVVDNDINLIANTSSDNTWNTGADKIAGVITEKISSPSMREEGNSPVANAIVYLLNQNGQKLTYTTTDANGNYSFKNIKAGSYQIKVEYAGVQYTAPATVVADGNPSTVETVSVLTSRETVTSLGYKERTNLLTIFPIPTDDVLTILLPSDAPANVVIVNSTGQIMMENQVSPNNNTINVNALQEGMYIIKMFSGERFYVSQFTKK